MATDAENPTLLQVPVLERIDRTKNIARFYVLSIEPTLFEDLALVRRWGRIGSAGRERIRLIPIPIKPASSSFSHPSRSMRAMAIKVARTLTKPIAHVVTVA